MVDPNLDYTQRQIKKHQILLEDHFKANPCPDCINKHLTAIEGYAEEGITLSDNPLQTARFVNLAIETRNQRKKFEEALGI